MFSLMDFFKLTRVSKNPLTEPNPIKSQPPSPSIGRPDGSKKCHVKIEVSPVPPTLVPVQSAHPDFRNGCGGRDVSPRTCNRNNTDNAITILLSEVAL